MVLEQFTVPGFLSSEPIPADHLMCMLQCERRSVSVTEIIAFVLCGVKKLCMCTCRAADYIARMSDYGLINPP
jgi:hypothetical protein